MLTQLLLALFGPMAVLGTTILQRAVVDLVPGSEDGVSGRLIFRPAGGGVLIEGTIYGLAPGKHGFHIHTKGDLTNQCKDAKGHFNPDNVDHKGPLDHVRHAGDLGNIVTPAHGPTVISMRATGFTLGDGGPRDALGRAVVVHVGEDDLGRGEDEGSRKTGNAGARAACGTIVLGERKPLHPVSIIEMLQPHSTIAVLGYGR